jgi:hypothetical protein
LLYCGEVRGVAVEQHEAPARWALIGHPLRWQLLHELARSDLPVREEVGIVTPAQNLMSYHLGCLRLARVMSVRHSAADRRQAYYRLNLERRGELQSRVGQALHPGLRLVLARSAGGPGPLRQAVRVLFLCISNRASSQMAQALLQQTGGKRVEMCSAGSQRPSGIPTR